MTSAEIQATGLVTYWSIREGGCWIDSLREKLPAAYAELLHPMTYEAALKIALHEAFGPAYLVRTLKAGKGFQVVRETKRTDENEYSPEMVWLFDGGCQQQDHAYFSQVERAIPEILKRSTAQAVGVYLAAWAQKCGGVSLRPFGGLYWIPESVVPLWEQIAKAVEQSAVQGATVWQLTTIRDAGTVAAIRDGLVESVTAEVNELMEKISSGEVGPRFLKNAQKNLGSLTAKVREYEAVLAESLPALTEALEQCETAAATAVLALSASDANAPAAA